MFKLPPLAYAYDALEPTISSATMHVHHDKHHAKYVDTMNEMLAGQAPASLEEVIVGSASDPRSRKLFNNAAQTWNHAFFWCCMAPSAAKPSGALAEAIARDFGDVGKLKEAFVAEGVGHFGSGWVWRAADGSKLKVLSTHDGENLLTHEGLTPLIVCDLWEHAYYLDYKNDRKGFLEAWFDAVADWNFAGVQFDAASGPGKPWRYEDA
jgi:superoxide dismutase, Fe-Mn family